MGLVAAAISSVPAGSQTPGAGASAGGAVFLEIDASRSDLGFTIHRSGETIDGRAHRLSGEVAVVPSSPGERASVVLRVEAASLETGNRLRDRKMRNSHLEVERFPEIVFRSTAIRLSDAGPAAPLRPGEPRKTLVEGILGLHGVERAILFPATIRYDSGSLTAEGDVTLRLTDHAIPIPRFLWIVLDDEVKVRFRFVASPRPAAPSGTPAPATAPLSVPPGTPGAD